MANLSENITRAVQDFQSIKTAIINKGITIPDNTPTSDYATKISEISGSATKSFLTYSDKSFAEDESIKIKFLALNPITDETISIYENDTLVTSIGIRDNLLPNGSNIMNLTFPSAVSGNIKVQSDSFNVGIIKEVGFEIPAATGDETPTEYGNMYVYTKTNYQTYMPGWKAFNNTYTDSSDIWHPNSGNGQWIAIEFPVPVCLKQFSVRTCTDYPDTWGTFTLAGTNESVGHSNTESDAWLNAWTDIKQYSMEQGANQYLTFRTDNNASYYQYRWFIDSVPTDGWAVVANIFLDEYQAANDVINSNLTLCNI